MPKIYSKTGSSGVCRKVSCEHWLDLGTGNTGGFGHSERVQLTVPVTSKRTGATPSSIGQPELCNKEAVLAVNQSKTPVSCEYHTIDWRWPSS